MNRAALKQMLVRIEELEVKVQELCEKATKKRKVTKEVKVVKKTTKKR